MMFLPIDSYSDYLLFRQRTRRRDREDPSILPYATTKPTIKPQEGADANNTFPHFLFDRPGEGLFALLPGRISNEEYTEKLKALPEALSKLVFRKNRHGEVPTKLEDRAVLPVHILRQNAKRIYHTLAGGASGEEQIQKSVQSIPTEEPPPTTQTRFPSSR